MGGSPGLVVMRGDSRLEGCGFESQHRILDGHCSTSICCKKLYCLFEKTKINEKQAGGWPMGRPKMC